MFWLFGLQLACFRLEWGLSVSDFLFLNVLALVDFFFVCDRKADFLTGLEHRALIVWKTIILPALHHIQPGVHWKPIDREIFGFLRHYELLWLSVKSNVYGSAVLLFQVIILNEITDCFEQTAVERKLLVVIMTFWRQLKSSNFILANDPVMITVWMLYLLELTGYCFTEILKNK